MEVEPLLECLALASDEIRIHALDLGRDPFDSHANLLNTEALWSSSSRTIAPRRLP